MERLSRFGRGVTLWPRTSHRHEGKDDALMGKLGKIALAAVIFWAGLALLHGWLNLNLDPAAALGLKKAEVAEGARFRVGFLPVT